MEAILPAVWFFITGFTLVLFIVLDGADLGIGVLALGASESRRSELLDAIGPFWYANETWLVIAGAILFGAFPLAYGIVFSALYIPAMMLIFGLMFRAVSIEFMDHSGGKFWGVCLGVGSLLAILGQGFVLGGLITGVNIAGRAFVGGPWDWANPMSFLVALGTLAGYLLLAAAYLVNKGARGPQDKNWRILQLGSWAAYGFFVMAVILLPLVRTPLTDAWGRHVLQVLVSGGLYIYATPVLLILAIFAFIMIFIYGARRRNVRGPYVWSIILALSVIAAIVAAIYPFIVPYSVSIQDAASSQTSLTFMLYGAAVFLPIIVAYNLFVRRALADKNEKETIAGG